MNRLAEAASAEWKAETGGYRLVRPAQKLRDAAAVEAALRTKQIGTALAERVAQVAKMPAWDQKVARMMADRYLGRVKAMQSGGGSNDTAFTSALASAPIERAGPALLQLIGANALGSISPGSRVVYSTQANRMQRQLPSAAIPVLRSMVLQQAMFAEEYSKVKPNDGSTYYFGGADPDIGSGNPALGPGKAIVILESGRRSVSALIYVNDTNAKPLMKGRFSLIPKVADTQFEGLEKVEVPADGIALARAISEASSTGSRGRTMMMSMLPEGPISFESATATPAGAKLSPQLKQLILRPEEFEPLAQFVGPVVAGLSKSKNLVAFMPDTSFDGLIRLVTGELTSGRLRKGLYEGGLELVEKDGWMVGKPTHPSHAIERRVNRIALGKLVRSMDEQGYATLMDLCNFAIAQQKRVGFGEVDAAYLMAASPGIARKAVDALAHPAVLRVYGTMSPAQRSNLAAGRKIKVGSLTFAQRQWLTEEIFQWWGGTHVVGGMLRGNGDDGIQTERTELMPNGIPSGAPLSVQIAEEPAVYGKTANGEEANIVTPAQLASHQYQNERSDMTNLGPPLVYETFTPAKKAIYSFAVELAPGYLFGHSADDVWVQKGGAAVPYDRLPAEIRDQTEKLLDRMRKAFGRMEGGRLIPPAPL
jgi:hypothetical protein